VPSQNKVKTSQKKTVHTLVSLLWRAVGSGAKESPLRLTPRARAPLNTISAKIEFSELNQTRLEKIGGEGKQTK